MRTETRSLRKPEMQVGLVRDRWSVARFFEGQTRAKGKHGKPDIFDKDAKTDPTLVDQCRICDVDWNWMHNDAGIDAGKRWDAMFEPYDPKKCWFKPEYIEKQKKLHLDLYGTREEYMRRRGIWTTLLWCWKCWMEPGYMGWLACLATQPRAARSSRRDLWIQSSHFRQQL